MCVAAIFCHLFTLLDMYLGFQKWMQQGIQVIQVTRAQYFQKEILNDPSYERDRFKARI